MKKSFMSIDPGLNGTGWAIFNGKKLEDQGVLTFRDNLPWEERAQMYGASIRSLHISYGVNQIFCEYPAFFDSAGGTMVAKKGDLLKLTYVVGLFGGMVCPTPFHLIPVHVWKGQLPKEVVNKRIKAILGEKKCVNIKTHAWDAVGIGLHILGEL